MQGIEGNMAANPQKFRITPRGIVTNRKFPREVYAQVNEHGFLEIIHPEIYLRPRTARRFAVWLKKVFP